MEEKKFLTFETLEEYKEWTKGPYSTEHAVFICLPSKTIYVKLKIPKANS